MIRVFCDFDGTITRQDTIVFLTERFGGGPRFRREVVDAIKAGRMPVAEGIRLELATIRATWEEAVAALDAEIRIDPGFEEFVGWCSKLEVPAAVLSSGMMPVVRHFVGRFPWPIFAHDVEIGAEGWTYRRLPEQDKETILAALSPEDYVVFVGDGTSDVAAIPYVDLLFAKEGRYLASHCRANAVPFVPFASFCDVQAHLTRLMAAGDLPMPAGFGESSTGRGLEPAAGSGR